MSTTTDERLATLVAQARDTLREAIADHVLADKRELAAVVVLFSGGNDSTVLAHLFRDMATHAAHANTGIGIEQTREFVRSTRSGPLCSSCDERATLLERT